MTDHHRIVIIGGGSAGLTVAARLNNRMDKPDIAIVEPSDKHYYQPLWTLVGGGVFPKEATERDEKDFIPRGATWIKDSAASFDPDARSVVLASGRTLSYDYLVVAAGIQLDWHKIKGLDGQVGQHGICSNYSYSTVESTWENIRSFRGGTALFTQPGTPIKCGGAPQKICYLAEDYFRRHSVRDQSKVIFLTATPGIFAVKKYAEALRQVISRKNIEARYQHDLVEVRPEQREAVFQNLANGEKVVIAYDLLHVTPPMGPPDFLASSPLAGEGGWVAVDQWTMQHDRFANVFALGDCSSLPTSKTGAAIRQQAPVLVDNLLSAMCDKPLTSKYDGYTSCPLVTGYGTLILAEFDYDLQPQESFPFDQSKERYSMYALKAHALPRLYWHGMLRGRF
jgi:sulfide:quinone oxidoreductase